MRTLTIFFAIGLTAMSSAHAGGVVNLCGADDEGGAGLNLAHALEGGGVVQFYCPPGTVIAMHRLHTLGQAILIDGGDNVTLDAGGASAMFSTVGDSVPIGFRHIVLRNGRVGPGPIVTNSLIQGEADLTLDSVQINSSETPILARSVTISDSKFIGNTGTVITTFIAVIKGSEFSNNDGPPLQQPQLRPGPWSRATIEGTHFNGNGPVYWDGTSEITGGTSFVNNGRGATKGGALWIAGDATVEKTEFINNTAMSGGAIWLEIGSLHVRRGTFRGNRASENGGAIAIAPASPWGGDASIRLTYSTFRQNTARDGGAIHLGRHADPAAHLVGDAVTFGGNGADQSGGAIYAAHGSVKFSRALFVANRANDEGGAIFSGPMPEDKVRLGNALIVRNAAQSGGGFRASMIELVNSTVADNNGGGFSMRPLSGLAPEASGELKLKNTIVVNNQTGNCGAIPDRMSFMDAGNNIQHPGTDCGPTLPSTDPALDSFYVPLTGSPARFAGDNDTCVQDELVHALDIYSYARPEGSRCTIGAVEGDLERHALRALRRPRDQPLAEPLRRLLDGLGIRRYQSP